MRSSAIIAACCGVAAATSATVSPVSIVVEAGPPASPGAGNGKVTNVVVGSVDAAGVVTPSFSPSSVTAAVGDTIRFLVEAGNITIVQTTIDTPCKALAGGAKSRELSNSDARTPPPSFDFVVKDKSALYFTSSDPSVCMAGNAVAVNADANNAGYIAFVQKAVAMNKDAAAANGIVVSSAVSQSAAGETFSVTVQGAASTGSASGSQASIVPGKGKTGNGKSCGCQCLCGVNSFPQSAGMGMFGGFLGQMSKAPARPQTISTSSTSASTAAKRSATPIVRRAKSNL